MEVPAMLIAIESIKGLIQNVNGDYKSLGVLGGLIQTTFKF